MPDIDPAVYRAANVDSCVGAGVCMTAGGAVGATVGAVVVARRDRLPTTISKGGGGAFTTFMFNEHSPMRKASCA